MNVSVCMIVRDEEKHIARCLQSIPASFEVIVVDTGSVDQTALVAERLGAKVHHFRWGDDFAEARNYSISLASGDYILILDADEELEPFVEPKLSDFVERFPDRAGTVLIENLTDGEVKRHRMVRFFPNGKSYSFEGIVHEKICRNGQTADAEDTSVLIKHYGYEANEYAEKQKAKRYLELYRKHLERNPHDGYMLYQLGKLHYSIGELEAAEQALKRCFSLKEEANLYFPVMLVMLGYVLKDMGRSAEAESLLAPYVPFYTSFPDLPFLMGLLAMDTGKLAAIEHYFKAALQIGETTKYTSVWGVGSFKAAYNLGVFYEITGQRDKAIQSYQSAAAHRYEPAVQRLNIVLNSL